MDETEPSTAAKLDRLEEAVTRLEGAVGRLVALLGQKPAPQRNGAIGADWHAYAPMSPVIVEHRYGTTLVVLSELHQGSRAVLGDMADLWLSDMREYPSAGCISSASREAEPQRGHVQN
jgi:hypothetical protein